MLIKDIEKLVEAACKESTNHFGFEAWTHHILPVVRNAKIMAKRVGADEEIVEISALLHDYAGIKDYTLEEDHHIHGAKLAEQILKEYNYPVKRIEQVKHCILSHRGSKINLRLSKEAQCIADADSMAHFYAITSLICLAFSNHKMNVDEVNKWLMQKLERSWNKSSLEARELINDRYEAIKLIFGGN